MFSAVKVLLAPSDFQARIWRWTTAVILMGSPARGVSPPTPKSAGNSVTSRDAVSMVPTQSSGTFTYSLRIKRAVPGKCPTSPTGCDYSFKAVYWLLYVIDQSIYYLCVFWGCPLLSLLSTDECRLLGVISGTLPFSSAKGKSDPHLLVPGFHYQPVKWRYSVVSDSGWYPTRLLHPWDFLGNNTEVGCCFLLQGIFPNQRSNPGLLHCRRILYQLSHKGSPCFNNDNFNRGSPNTITSIIKSINTSFPNFWSVHNTFIIYFM